jgi:hypothetical protein
MSADAGVRCSVLATRTIGTCVRSAARYRISLIGLGQASASTQICMPGDQRFVATMMWNREKAVSSLT